MNSDFKDLLRSFLNFRVKLLVVGGFAVIRYTEPRYTKDMDLWIDNSAANAHLTHDAKLAAGRPQDLVDAGALAKAYRKK